jgi:alpha-tubulin suppressor-like RCC1 family protein
MGRVIKIQLAGGIDYGSLYLLDENGSIFSCGSNSNGQLGIGSETNPQVFTEVIKPKYIKFVDISPCGGSYYDGTQYNRFGFMAADQYGDIWACGYPTDGQVPILETTVRTILRRATIT